MKEKISIQFVDFSSVEAVAEALKRVYGQNTAADLEITVCDPEGKLGVDELCRESNGVTVNVLKTNRLDPFGILSATGDYIAIYEAGTDWNEGKLERQLKEFWSNPGCTLVVHDVELIKENGYPVDQNIRNTFIRALGFEERRYGIDRLQKFESCGFWGTWMFKNLFTQEKERTLYETCDLDPQTKLKTLLVANGECLNLYDARLASWQPDEQLYESKMYPQYEENSISQKLHELAVFQDMLKNYYGIETDGRYRLLSIVNGAFNGFVKGEKTEASVRAFMDVFGKGHCEEYLEDTELRTAERDFFAYLRNKIRMHLTNDGTDVELPLVACLDGTTDEEWTYSIRNCKNKVLKAAMLEKFTVVNPDAKQILAVERRKKSAISVFVGRVVRKLKKIFNRVRYVGKRLILRRMRKQGYTEYMSNEWYDTVRNNLLNDKETPLKTKLWCYRRGFMPWRIFQYELTEENFGNHLSDRDYMYLHQMNNSYKKWIEDKMTFRLVLDPYKQHLPKYYYQIIQRDDKQLLLKLPDCPSGYEATFDELFRLLREKGKLALKAASGTHGVGFYKMHYEDGKYYLNNEETTEHGIRKTINGFKSYYIVTEYINMHDDIKRIYPGSVNTIRVMMINRDGHHPELMDAYMRIGSEKSGVTDNVAYGGVVCTVDLETGEFGNGMQIANHVFVSIDKHPDTGTPLQGTIPNWEIIKKGLVDISQYMGQLEYLGFDVVCTPEGFVLLEVNSHQDLHRLRYYDQRVKDFFFYKLRRKERRYKIVRKY